MMYPQVNAVIEILSVPNIRFNMSFPIECIGGHCAKHINPDKYAFIQLPFRFRGIISGFMQVSGISDETLADMVCFPRNDRAYKATVAQAINMLEYLRDYGIVDWARALGETHA